MHDRLHDRTLRRRHHRTDLDPDMDGFEACDDGNDADDDGCTTARVIAVCGDGFVRADLSEGDVDYEACDDGNAVDEDECLSCVPPCALR